MPGRSSKTSKVEWRAEAYGPSGILNTYGKWRKSKAAVETDWLLLVETITDLELEGFEVRIAERDVN